MPVEVLAVLVALLGGVVGYALREYLNRVNPLLEIIEIESRTKNSEEVRVDATTVDTLRDSFYIEEIKPGTNLGSVFQAWDRCDDLQKFWPETKEELEAVIQASSLEDFKTKLGLIVSRRYFGRWMTKLIINNHLDFQVTSAIEESPEQVHTWHDDEGQVWFDLPPSGPAFATKLNHPALRDKHLPFFTAISRLHRPGIIAAFKRFIEILDADYEKALKCTDVLKRLHDENGRWGTKCFIANTSHSPITA